MEKKCKAVLLPTDKLEKIGILKCIKSFCNTFDEPDKDLWDRDDISNLRFGMPINANLEFYKPQHLYILSNDKIKEGDWFILDMSHSDTLPNELHQYGKNDKSGINFKASNSWTKSCKKVIATTNVDLIKEGVASIDDEFIRSYCNNPVEEVIVRYKEAFISEGRNKNTGYFSDKRIFSRYYPKISSNCSIIIKPVEQTWDDIFQDIENTWKHDFHLKDEIKWYLKDNYEVPKKKQ